MSILNPFLENLYTKTCTKDCTFSPLQVGDTAVIALPANPSTGYSWSLASSNTNAEVTTEEYVRGCSRLIGAPGVTKFTVFAVFAGTANLEFVYQRPWSGEVAKRIKVTIPIKWAKMPFSKG